MDGEIDFTKNDDSELLEILSRIDPQRAPGNYARLRELLAARGFIVRDALIGPGSAVPSPEKLQSLIGSPRPIESRVAFGRTTGLFSWLEPAHNDFQIGGFGKLEADGIFLRLSGQHTGALRGLLGPLFQRHLSLSWRRIVDVESIGSAVHLVYRIPDATNCGITIWFPDQSAAEQLSAVLPKERTPEFSPRLKATAQFERDIVAQSPHTPVTVGLVAINILVFLATFAAGAELISPEGSMQVPWGSNFGPYTSDGEWWRLLTSTFLHFGVLHLLVNIWALASFGPLVERLYGSVNYLLLYLIAGVAGSLASISWEPAINSAGASAAIFGILGALLAAQLRVGESFPENIVRPLRNSTLIFTGYCLISGFTSTGVDNAAHLGGLATGFLMGLLMTRPITGKRAYTRSDLRRLARTMPLTLLLIGGGVWSAEQASQRLSGEGLYLRTWHWMRRGEQKTNDRLIAVRDLAKAGKLDTNAIADRLEREALPFWREAAARTATIHLAQDSKNLESLKVLQEFSRGRVR